MISTRRVKRFLGFLLNLISESTRKQYKFIMSKEYFERYSSLFFSLQKNRTMFDPRIWDKTNRHVNDYTLKYLSRATRHVKITLGTQTWGIPEPLNTMDGEGEGGIDRIKKRLDDWKRAKFESAAAANYHDAIKPIQLQLFLKFVISLYYIGSQKKQL